MLIICAFPTGQQTWGQFPKTLKTKLNDIHESIRPEFDSITDFTEEIRKWLVIFVNFNEDRSVLVAQLQEETQEFKEKVLNQRVKMDITTPPMKYHI